MSAGFFLIKLILNKSTFQGEILEQEGAEERESFARETNEERERRAPGSGVWGKQLGKTPRQWAGEG